MSEGVSKWENYLTVASLTDMGMRRTSNQDSLCISFAGNSDQWVRRGHLFIVADGMGAHAAGELASKLAVDQIPHLYSKYREMPPADGLKRAIVDANTEIHRRGQANEEFHHMGTTCSALVLLTDGAVVAHVGDSRVYRLRGNRLEQLTFDHSLVWEMRATGQLAGKEDLVKVPKNVITRSLGPYPDVNVDLEGPFRIEPGDTFLLCSDGLSGQLADGEIGAILGVLTPQEAARIMVDIANLRGGPDNSTAIIVRVDKPLPSAETRNAVVSGSSSPTGFLPLLWVLVAISFALAGLFFWFWNNNVAAGVAGLVGMAALIVILVRLTTQTVRMPFLGNAVRINHGRGPYTQTDCNTSGWELIHKLKDITEQIKTESRNREWGLDLAKLAELVSVGDAAAQQKDLRGAIRGYAQAISFLMDQLRNQGGASATSIDL